MTGALRAGRAAAFLTLATGINGTVAALEPRYEPIYVYLVAVVIVAWLGGLLLGVSSAIAAVVLYDSMFGPGTSSLSMSSVVPLVVAIGAAVMTQLVRAPLHRPAFPATKEPPLLAVPTVVSVTPAVDTRELDDLRLQLAETARRADEARTAAENEARLRIESSATAKARLAGLQRDLDTARRDAIDQAKRASALQGQLEELGDRDRGAAQRITALEAELGTSRSRLAELESRVRETAEELEVAWRRVDEEKSRADAERGRINDLERRANDALQNVTSDLAAQYQQPLAEAKTSLGDAIARIAQTERERDEALKQAADLQARLLTIEREREVVQNRAGDVDERVLAAQRERDEARERIAAAQERVAVAERERDEARRHAAEAITRIDRELTAREDTEAVWREKMRLALEEAERKQATLREEAAGQAAAMAAREKALRDEMSAAFDTKLQSIVGGITSDYEDALGQATVEREGARAEVRSANQRIESLVKKAAEANVALRRASTEIDTLNAALERAEQESEKLKNQAQTDFESRMHASETRAASLQNALDRMREDLENAQTETELARSEGERVERERDERDATIAALTQQIEEIPALVARAKEEAQRERNDRLTEYASKVMQAELRASALQNDMERLQKEAEDSRSQLEIERSQRERDAIDFDRKINSIVAGITNDHEQALGEAMVEKEAARAEARSLAKKVEVLQRKVMDFDDLQGQVEKSTGDLRKALETERTRAGEEKAKREKIEAEWSENLNKIVMHLASDHEADIGQMMMEREAAKAEARDLANKVKALQRRLEEERGRVATMSAERPTAAGTTQRPAIVLVVHSDAGTRAMTKHALELSGYNVVTAADGLEGLRVAASQRPDVVLAEAVMPKMNGRELVQLLKARPETARIKVVLISGDSGDRDRGDFRADDVLPTPSDFEAMRATLASVLAK